VQSLVAQLCELLAEEGSHQTIRNATSSLVAQISATSDEFRARQHPLGFFWIALTDRAAQRALRLHLWPEGPAIQNPDFLIHDHTFSFKSVVLQGEIRNDEYAVTESESGEKQLFRVEYDQTSSLLVPSGVRVNCQLVHSASCKAGEFYSLPATTYHATRLASGEFAATLVLTRADPGKTAHVIGPATSGDTYLCERGPVEVKHVAGYLERLLMT
jgi:hypothetical protein